MRSTPALTFIGFFLAASAAATAAPQPGDTVVKVPVTPTPASGTDRPGDGQAPIANDTVGAGPVKAATTQALLQDVASSYDQMERNIELQFAKLMQEAKGQKQALEDKIKEIDRQIAALKEQARKIEQVAQKLEELLPRILAAVGSDSGGMRRTPSAKGDQLAALLASERAKAGLPATPGFPNLTPADLSTASSLKGSNGAAFLSSRIAQQASEKIAEIDKAIEAKKKEIASLKAQIAELDKQLAKLEADKQKAIAELRKQKEKAIAEATKAQDSRLIRIPTPTPTPKRP